MNAINLSRESKDINQELWIIYLLIVGSLLTPSLRFGGYPAIRVEQLIVIFYFAVSITKVIKGANIYIRDKLFPYMFLWISFFMVLSIFVGLLKGIKIKPNDFFEIYKIFIYSGVYFIVSKRIVNNEARIKVLNFLRFAIFLSILISVQQYFNILGLNEKYVPLIAPTQYGTLVNNYPWPRVIGMTGNPNVYAIIPSIGAIISWAFFIEYRQKKDLLLMLIFIVGMLMTLSRGGFIFLMTGLISYFLISSFKIKRAAFGKVNIKELKSFVVGVIVFVLIIVFIFVILPDEFSWRIKAGFNFNTDRSFQVRLVKWGLAMEQIKLSPIFGIGPAKASEDKFFIDNEWLLLMSRYGIVGTLYLVMVFLIPVVKCEKSLFRNIYISILCASSLYMIPLGLFHSFELMPIIMIIIGLLNEKKNDRLCSSKKR